MEQNETPVKVLSLFELNKEGRESFVVQLVERIDEGEVDAMLVHLQVKGMEKIIDALTETDEKKNPLFESAKKYKNLVLSAVQQHGVKQVDFRNAKFEIKEVGVKYDYSQCNDPEVSELLAQSEVIKKKLTERQKFLQTVPGKGLLITNEETGETNTVYPPSKSSTTSIQCTLK